MLRVPSLILSHHATTDYFSGLQHDTGPTIQEKKNDSKTLSPKPQLTTVNCTDDHTTAILFTPPPFTPAILP